MEELLKEMMDNGLLIYRRMEPEPSAKFVLKKVPTPYNTSRSLTDEECPDTSLEYFMSFESAVERAKVIIGWKDEEPEPDEGCWQGTIMYRHALGPRFEDLGTTEAADYQEAMIYFNRQAESFICEYGEELGIEDSEVKVRPCEK